MGGNEHFTKWFTMQKNFIQLSNSINEDKYMFIQLKLSNKKIRIYKASICGK